MGESTNKVGRPPVPVEYRKVTYNDIAYIIGTVKYLEEKVDFIIDYCEYDKIKERAWHIASENYISSSFIHDGKRKEVYLHNLIMNRELFQGKGQKESVDHINRNGLDNRKENLRILSQTDQNINQVKKKRNVVLPEGCGIKSDDIPKHIWYVQPNGLHGDRFAITFKTENLTWKSTSSKKISLNEKLEQAKAKLAEFYIKYPYLNPTYESEKIEELHKSFNNILSL